MLADISNEQMAMGAIGILIVIVLMLAYYSYTSTSIIAERLYSSSYGVGYRTIDPGDDLSYGKIKGPAWAQNADISGFERANQRTLSNALGGLENLANNGRPPLGGEHATSKWDALRSDIVVAGNKLINGGKPLGTEHAATKWDEIKSKVVVAGNNLINDGRRLGECAYSKKPFVGGELASMPAKSEWGPHWKANAWGNGAGQQTGAGQTNVFDPQYLEQAGPRTKPGVPYDDNYAENFSGPVYSDAYRDF